MINFLSMGLYFDYYFLGIILIPGIILGIIAESKVQSAFHKNAAIFASSGISASDAARRLLNAAGLENVPVNRIGGNLTDNYNPKNKSINLSADVYDSSNLASLGVMAHEVGHAIQHKQKYFPLMLRRVLIPLNNIVSRLLWPIIVIGLMTNFVFLFADIGTIFIYAGIGMFGLTTLISLITLPVELNASKRAYSLLTDSGILFDEEIPKVKEVLNAAALTYVASLVMSLLNLLRFVLIFKDRD